MAKAWKVYTKEMAKKFGYLATWAPGVPLKVGDIGILRQNLFRRIGGLEDCKISFEVRADTSPTSLSHVSDGKVTINFKPEGALSLPNSVLKQIQAGFTIEFSNENAIVFEANGCLNPSIQDQITLGQKIIDLYIKGQWNKDWVVITELVKTDSATVLISAAKEAKIEISVSGSISATNINLGDASANMKIEYMRNMHTRIIAEKGQSLTPLFRAQGIKSYYPINVALAGVRLSGMDLETPLDGRADLYFGDFNYEQEADEADGR
jgi:hypothetical protein